MLIVAFFPKNKFLPSMQWFETKYLAQIFKHNCMLHKNKTKLLRKVSRDPKFLQRGPGQVRNGPRHLVWVVEASEVLYG